MHSSSPNTHHPTPITIELLAPAKNLECGIAAIDHGADAVYIGASRFGARQSAGNSVEDIGKLCDYAHRYGATVHVTINTIIYNDEIDDTLALVRSLVDVGVDAFLLQDMGLMSKVREIVPDTVALHASTQCDTRTWEKAQWLSQQGFDRVVLARELSAEEISDIHKKLPDLELEAFIHGALCVSYSGVCYVSQYSFGRSANRGACAQFCRLAFDLKDSDGKTIEHQRHLLSLKDMSQIDNLETLMRSGACAFKIEGRLKDINYVKNVVSAYSKRIDEIIRKHPGEFRRASLGRVRYSFTPDLKKTFNRGYTNYFLKGRQADIFSPNTPKALGEFVGRVKEIRRDSFTVSSTANFANGDGLCFLSRDAESQSTRLEGFRVNRAVGNRLYPFKMPRGLKPGMGLYRNQDQAFDKELSGKTAERKIQIKMWFGTSPKTSPNPSEGGEHLTESRGVIWARAEVIGSKPSSYEQTPDQHPILNQTSNQHPVLNQTSDQYPVLNQTPDQYPVSNQTSDQHPVSNQTSNQHPVSNQTSDQYPVLNQTSDQYPVLNQTSDQHPVLNQISDQHPVSNQTSDWHPISDPTSHETISNEHPVRFSPPLEGLGEVPLPLPLAQKPQRDNIIRQLTKLGNTVYECADVEIVDGADKYFIPSSILADLRRIVIENLDKQIMHMQRMTIHRKSKEKQSDPKLNFLMVNPAQYQQLPYLYNISNDAARKFYEQQGLTKVDSAFELQYPAGVPNGSKPTDKSFSIQGDKEAVSNLLMQCRHCIRYSLGYCVKWGGQKPTWREPLFLELPDKRRFRLEFDCKNCQMNVCNVT